MRKQKGMAARREALISACAHLTNAQVALHRVARWDCAEERQALEEQLDRVAHLSIQIDRIHTVAMDEYRAVCKALETGTGYSTMRSE